MHTFEFTHVALLKIALGVPATFADTKASNLRLKISSNKKVFCYSKRRAKDFHVVAAIGTFPQTTIERARSIASRLDQASEDRNIVANQNNGAYHSARMVGLTSRRREQMLSITEVRAYLDAADRLAAFADQVLARSAILLARPIHQLAQMRGSELFLDEQVWRSVGGDVVLGDELVEALQILVPSLPVERQQGYVFGKDGDPPTAWALRRLRQVIDSDMRASAASRGRNVKSWNWTDLRRTSLALLRSHATSDAEANAIRWNGLPIYPDIPPNHFDGSERSLGSVGRTSMELRSLQRVGRLTQSPAQTLFCAGAAGGPGQSDGWSPIGRRFDKDHTALFQGSPDLLERVRHDVRFESLDPHDHRTAKSSKGPQLLLAQPQHGPSGP